MSPSNVNYTRHHIFRLTYYKVRCPYTYLDTWHNFDPRRKYHYCRLKIKKGVLFICIQHNCKTKIQCLLWKIGGKERIRVFFFHKNPTCILKFPKLFWKVTLKTGCMFLIQSSERWLNGNWKVTLMWLKYDWLA